MNLLAICCWTLPWRLMYEDRVPPSQYSRIMMSKSFSWRTWRRRMMLGWSTEDRKSSSFSKQILRLWLSFERSKHFITASSPVNMCFASQTVEVELSLSFDFALYSSIVTIDHHYLLPAKIPSLLLTKKKRNKNKLLRRRFKYAIMRRRLKGTESGSENRTEPKPESWFG